MGVRFREGGLLVVKKNIDKGESLKVFAQYLSELFKRKVTEKNVLVVGDSNIDLPMINPANGILLSNNNEVEDINAGVISVKGGLDATEYIFKEM